MDNRPRYRVPDELRETLLDFTIAYLLERPNNLADFGLNFFQRLKREREGTGGGGPPTGAVNGGTGGPAEELEGRQLVLDEAITDWMLHFSIHYMLENPPDLVAFGLEYCQAKLAGL
ncbi:unnamed protein product [Allacma fusca]|uniref:RIIa domain-containing protein n=1 Tax=Allacma fusca TaxID=39272 RepID=A0A8J2JV86_9HEXA|nr:unnamed protein product [Allacma fusca]